MIKSYDSEKMAAKALQCLAVFSLLFIIAACDITQRTVTVTSWPDCDDYKEDCERAKQNGSNIVYAKASSKEHDNLYYVFSTIGLPTIIVAHTKEMDTDLTFNWTKLMEGNGSIVDAINFKSPINEVYLFGVAFTRLLEYDDKDDTADLEECEKKLDAASWNIRDFSLFTWDPAVVEKENTFVFNTTSDVNLKTNETRNGSISFAFSVKGQNGRASDLPRLLFNSNETLFDFVIANYTPSFNNSRFALEVAVISKSKNEMDVDLTRSIDDEYAPGVFQITDWLTNPQARETSGFFQWKPVAYISKSRGRNTATKVNHYKLQDLTHREHEAEQLNSSVIWAFNSSLWNDKSVIIRIANISFGLPKDGFYVKNNYTAWSAAMGYGKPPEDSISTMVIIIISAGLGIPVIIIIFGSIFTVVRRLRQRATGYIAVRSDPIN
ncbi:unnamed protein product [Lymnaea stagnalis]|uniref:Uncharacterized protein n=1 Tax=Lymnaea stagnalis TaxID=6523 RepID=A0AAV2GXJ3_LYMST